MGSRSWPMTTTMSTPPDPVPDRPTATKGTAIFSYTCVGLTGVAIVAVVFFYCNRHVRRSAPVAAAAGGSGGPEEDASGGGVADVAAKIPEFAFAGSARISSGRRGGGGGEGSAQCSVCLGAVQRGEMVRLLPACKHMYHVECIDMWLASHATCPLCRTDVEPPPTPPVAAAADEALPPV